QPGQPVRVAVAAGEEAVAETSGAFGCGNAVPADVHGDRRSVRARAADDSGERYGLAAERRRCAAPQGAHGSDALREPGTAPGEIHAERVELLAEPPRADPEHQPTPDQYIERGSGLRGDERIPLGENQDRGAQPDPL